jgi:hypothetical protein
MRDSDYLFPSDTGGMRSDSVLALPREGIRLKVVCQVVCLTPKNKQPSSAMT